MFLCQRHCFLSNILQYENVSVKRKRIYLIYEADDRISDRSVKVITSFNFQRSIRVKKMRHFHCRFSTTVCLSSVNHRINFRVGTYFEYEPNETTVNLKYVSIAECLLFCVCNDIYLCNMCKRRIIHFCIKYINGKYKCTFLSILKYVYCGSLKSIKSWSRAI